MRRTLGIVFGLALLVAPAPAAAAPVATNDATYTAFGRVFTDPLGGCQQIGTSPCDPAAEGNVPATSFIGVNEFRDGLEFMNSNEEWQRYMEVLILDGKDGEGSATKDEVTADPGVMFPGNNLPPEFTPRPGAVSAGLPTPTLEREKSDLTIVRVTDESVPDAGKKRYTLSLSIHGIERAGIEGGTRAMEDLVTAATAGRSQDPILPEAVREGAPTFEEALKKTIVYFTYPNPDGWRRGTYDTGHLGTDYQRYNGNGVDPNRDYTDIGFNYRGYSGGSEPETRAFKNFYRDILGGGASFQAGDDLHGQPFADALSYTLLPHGRHDLAKDARIREAAKLINRAQYEATNYDPRIIENVEVSSPQEDCAPDTLGTACPQIYAQTWGSVYDTINYTTTGTVGDWFDSSIGLNADGIDNEMSFSHLDKHTRFDQFDEQLHVAGNKAIIFAHMADIIDPVTARFDAPGAMGYVPNKRVTRAEHTTTPGPPANTKAQDPIDDFAVPDPAENGASVYEFEVKRTAPDGNTPGIFNGGMTVTATGLNFQGLSTGSAKLYVQCKHCDDHVGARDADADEWITIAEDYNQSPLYLQAGVIASVNFPDATYTDAAGKAQPVPWRVLVSTEPLGVASLPPAGPIAIKIEFEQDAVTDDGNNCQKDVCDEAPLLKAYDVANTDFFTDLNKYAADAADRFQAIEPRKVLAGEQSLDGLHTLVLADELLPGAKGANSASGPRTGDKQFSVTTVDNVPGGPNCERTATSTDTYDFAIPASDDNASMTVRIAWTLGTTDWDLYVQRKNAAGEYEDIASASASLRYFEELTIQNPQAGDYRVQAVFCSGDNAQPVEGTIGFTGRGVFDPSPSEYTDAERDAWVAKLKAFVEGGGNLVLTDKALTGLPALVPAIKPADVNQQTVYVGQMAVTRCADDAYDADGACVSEERTLDDPLMKDVNQPGSRFNTGFRRQVYEPTPLGFAIQDAEGTDASYARQFDVSAKAFTDAGGRVAATSADDGARDAGPVTNRVTVGELKLGEGQIRIAGALLPQPTNEFDHPLGLEPYAVTYTGYILACNLFGAACNVEKATVAEPVATPTPTVGVTPTPTPTAGVTPTPTATVTPAPTRTPGPGGGGGNAVCATNAGFRRVEVAPAGNGLRFSFTRRVDNPVRVDVYQTTRGRKVIGNKPVATFTNRTRSFTWNGAEGTDGLYVARLKMRGRGGQADVRRFTFSRENGVFVRRRAHYRRASCKLLQSFRLIQPGFGGATGEPLRIQFRLAEQAQVALTVRRRGSGVVKRYGARTYAADTRYRFAIPAKKLARGDYIVRILVKRGKQTLRASLVTRNI